MTPAPWFHGKPWGQWAVVNKTKSNEMKTETKHTPEPWKAYGLAIYTEANRVHWLSGKDALQSLIANVRDNYNQDPEDVVDNPPSMAEAEANASRIVACVNGCEGIVDPSAVKELLEALEAVLFSAEAMRDELESFQGFSGEPESMKAARAAIAKARGLEGGAK